MIPERVRAARELARAAGFVHSSTDEVGRLLRALSAGVGGRIGEIGTAYGVGASWIADGMPPSATLVTVETDEGRAGTARNLFADDSRITVICGDWSELRVHGPFDMIFVDGGAVKQKQPEAILRLVRPGGIVVMDDFTAIEDWDDERRRTGDPVREFWLADPRIAGAEVGMGFDKIWQRSSLSGDRGDSALLAFRGCSYRLLSSLKSTGWRPASGSRAGSRS